MDSPPPEEYLAGFWIMEAADLDVALKLAADLDVALKLAAEGVEGLQPARNQALGPSTFRRAAAVLGAPATAKASDSTRRCTSALRRPPCV